MVEIDSKAAETCTAQRIIGGAFGSISLQPLRRKLRENRLLNVIRPQRFFIQPDNLPADTNGRRQPNNKKQITTAARHKRFKPSAQLKRKIGHQGLMTTGPYQRLNLL
jgi:hypothetical protein